MGIKTYNPYTPSRRNMTGLDFSEITKSTPEKSLVVSMSKTAGRNNQGKITVRHHGGGEKRKYRIIDFKRNDKDGIPATVNAIEYDPNRSANIALLFYADGEKRYILAPYKLAVGDVLMSGAEAEIKVGNCLPLQNIPVGTLVHNIELYPGKGGQLVRSAGNSAQLMAKEGNVFTVGQISVMNVDPINEKKAEIMKVLEAIKAEKGYAASYLMVTDILAEDTFLWFTEGAESIVEKAFAGKPENGVAYLPHVMSRKKQVTPPLLKAYGE